MNRGGMGGLSELMGECLQRGVYKRVAVLGFGGGMGSGRAK